MIDLGKNALTREDMVVFITTATREVFSTMLGQDVTAEDSVVVTSSPSPASGVVSLVGLAGKWIGTGSIACTSSFACRLSSMFLIAEYDAINEEVLDAFAELTNMVIGNVKTFMEERVGSMGLSVPTVIFGQNFQTRNSGTNEWVVVPFLCGQDRFRVQLCLAPNNDQCTRTTRPGFALPHLVNL